MRARDRVHTLKPAAPTARPRSEEARIAALEKRLARERLARRDVEQIAERSTRALYDKQQELVLLEAVVSASNESSTEQEALQAAVDAVCAHASWPVGHALLHDPSSGDLVPTTIWHIEHADQFAAFRRVTEQTRFAAGFGLPGRVLATGKAAWITDGNTDPTFARPHLGVRGAFAFPILAGGEIRTVLEFFTAAPVAADHALLGVVTQIARHIGRVVERILAQEQLAHQATHDSLTGVANHRCLHDRLAEEVERARRENSVVSVIALDIDHFKAINDTYGHSEGDAALRVIAKQLDSQARTYDVVGRVGGEEFALVLPGVGPDGAFAMAERCRLRLAELSFHGVGVACSAGVASYPRDDPDGCRLVEMADAALYWAKRAGRAQVRSYDAREVTLLSGAEQHAQVREVLRCADAMTPVFQPIVELATGRIAGYEALTRFLHAEPVRPPDLWFAQARGCGLGPALEAQAIEVSLAVPGRPAGSFLSLNVSPGALLSDEVAAVLPRDLSEIVIELTEHELFPSDDAFDVHLAALRARGARIAVDDAGAGYAGLQRLIRTRPDILKLDRALIQGVHTDASKIALLEALSRFATGTGAAVCGEGVEDIRELQMLGRFDVTYAQGYALARPGPAWPTVAAEVVDEATSEARWGMRLVEPLATGDGAVTLGEVTGALARARSREDLNVAVHLVERLTHSDCVVVSRVLPDMHCVETLSEHDHDWGSTGEHFTFDEYPATERVIVDQALGQVIRGDPAANPAELRVLAREGFGALLMVPVIVNGESIGLLELYRRIPRPWTTTEIDQARVLTHQLGSAIPLLSETQAANSVEPR